MKFLEEWKRKQGKLHASQDRNLHDTEGETLDSVGRAPHRFLEGSRSPRELTSQSVRRRNNNFTAVSEQHHLT